MTGIILAGGRSLRMGTNKAMLPIGATSLIERVFGVLSGLCDEMIISINKETDISLKAKTIVDSYKNAGPAGGVLTALKASKNDINLIASCDTPFISTQLYEFLLGFAQDYEIVIPANGKNTEPLLGIYRRSAIAKLEQAITTGEFSMRRIAERCRTKIIDIGRETDFNASHIFFNINNIHQYREALRLIRS